MVRLNVNETTEIHAGGEKSSPRKAMTGRARVLLGCETFTWNRSIGVGAANAAARTRVSEKAIGHATLLER